MEMTMATITFFCSIMRPVPFLRSPSSLPVNAVSCSTTRVPDRRPIRPMDGIALSAWPQASRHPARHASGPPRPRRPSSLANSGNAPGKTVKPRLGSLVLKAAERPPPETSNAPSIVPPYVEPLHRGFKVFDKRCLRPVNGRRARNQNIVVAARGMQRDKLLRQRAQAPLCAIAAHRVANPAARRQTDPRSTFFARPSQGLQHEARGRPALARPGQTAEFRAPFQALECRSHCLIGGTKRITACGRARDAGPGPCGRLLSPFGCETHDAAS